MTGPFDGLPDIFIGTFGQAVTLVNNDGEERETSGIFNPRPVDALGATLSEAVLHLTADDADFVGGTDVALASIDGQWFALRTAEPDGKGMVPYRLEISDGP